MGNNEAVDWLRKVGLREMKGYLEEYGFAIVSAVTGLLLLGVLFYLLWDANGLQALFLAYTNTIGG